MLPSFPNSQATVMSVGDGFIQPHESRTKSSNKVSTTPFMLGDFFRKLAHRFEKLMKDLPNVDDSDAICCILSLFPR